MMWWFIIIISAIVAGIPAGLLLDRFLPRSWFRKVDNINIPAAKYGYRQPTNIPVLKHAQGNKSPNRVQSKPEQYTAKRSKEIPVSSKIHESPEITSPENEDVKYKNPNPKLNHAIENTREEPKPHHTSLKLQPGIFAEIESNLKIAVTPSTDKPVSFQTKMWDNNRSEINKLPVNIQSELGEVYIDMRLANNIAWLITEFGDSTREAVLNYYNLCTKIAERLTGILDFFSEPVANT